MAAPDEVKEYKVIYLVGGPLDQGVRHGIFGDEYREGFVDTKDGAVREARYRRLRRHRELYHYQGFDRVQHGKWPTWP